MTVLTREQILAAADLKTEVVSVPEWGGEVIVRALTGYDRDQLEAQVTRLEGVGRRQRVVTDMRNFRAKLVAASLVDEHGERMFSEADVDALGQKNAAALNRVFEGDQRLSGLSAAEMQELEKNSASGPRAASRSA